MTDQGHALPRSFPVPAFRRLGAVLALFAVHVLAALWIALRPAALAARATAGQPLGDAVLFEPGGVVLAEALRLARPALPWLGLATAGSIVVIAFVELVPIGALIAALGRRGRISAHAWLEDGVAHLGTLSVLEGIAIAAQVLVLVLAVSIGTSAASMLHLVAPAEDVVLAAFVLAGAFVALVLRFVHDLARVAAVDEGTRVYGAIVWALRVARRRGLRAFGAFAWRGVAAIALLAAAALAVSPRALAASLWVHAIAVLGAVYLRADWLGIAVATSRAVRREEAARSEAEPPSQEAPQPELVSATASEGMTIDDPDA